VSAATRAALRRTAPGGTANGADAPYVIRPLGTVTVKGRAEPVDVFAVG